MACFAPMPICKKCRRFDSPEHVCPPEWVVWNPDQAETIDDARRVFADDAADAVEMWAEEDDNDSAEYNIAKGQPATVFVQRIPDGPIEKYKVIGEYEPRYTAVPIQ